MGMQAPQPILRTALVDPVRPSTEEMDFWLIENRATVHLICYQTMWPVKDALCAMQPRHNAIKPTRRRHNV